MSVNVGDLVATLRMDTNGFTRSAQTAGEDTKKFQKTLADLDRQLDKLDRQQQTTSASTIAFGVVMGTALTQAIRKIGEFVLATLEIGRQARVQEAAFAAMARSVGQNADEIRERLIGATKGTIEFSESISAVNRLLAQGFDTSQIEALGRVSKSVAIIMGTDVTQAFEHVSQSILSGQTRMLRTAGIYVEAQRAGENYARSLGTTSDALTEAGRSQGIYNAVIAATARTQEALTDAIDPSIIAARQFAAQWREIREKVGAAADTIRTDFIQVIVAAWPKIQDLVSALTAAFGSLGKAITETAAALAPLAAQLLSVLTNVINAFNALPEAVKDFGILSILLWGKAGSGALGALLGRLGQIGLILTTIAIGYDLIATKIRGGVTETQAMNDLLAEQKRLVEEMARNPGALGTMERLKAVQGEILALQGQITDAFTRTAAATAAVAAGPAAPTGLAQVFPDKAAMAASTLGMQLLTYAYEMGTVSAGALSAKFVEMRDRLQPLSSQYPEVAARVRELDEQIKRLNEDVRLTGLGEQTRAQAEFEGAVGVTTSALRQASDAITELDRRLAAGLIAPLDYERAIQAVVESLRAVPVAGEGAGEITKDLQDRIEGLSASLRRLRAERSERIAGPQADESAAFQNFADQRVRIEAATSANEIRILEENIAARLKIMEEIPAGSKLFDELRLANLRDSLDKAVITEQSYQDRVREIEMAAQERHVQLLELRASAESRAAALMLREQLAAAEGVSGAWQAFSAGFQLQALSWGTTMQQFGKLGAEVAQNLFTAFDETFFQVFQGKFNDIDEIWKKFLAALLAEIAAFMAAQAVVAFIKFIAGGWGGGGGFKIPFFEQPTGASTTTSSGTTRLGIEETRLDLEQQSTGEARRRLVLEQQSTASVQAARDANAAAQANAERSRERSATIFGIQFDFGDAATVAMSGVRAGLTVATMNPVLIAINILKDFGQAAMRASSIAEAARIAAENLGIAQMSAMRALDRNMDVTTDLTQSTTNLTAAQTDLAIDTADVTDATVDVTASMNDLTSGLRDAGPALVAAVDAAREFANQAAEAAAERGPGDVRFTDRGAGPGGDIPRGVDFDPNTDPGGGTGAPGGGGGFPGGGGGGPNIGDIGRQHGGWIGGHGGADSQWIRATPGEFVMRAEVAQRQPRLMDAINAGRGPTASPEELALWHRQNGLLAEIRDAVKTRAGRLVGATA